MAEWPEAHFAIGIEAGLLSSPVGPLDVQACVVLDRGGRMTAGHGPGFSHPPPVGRAVEAGRSVGEAIAELAGDPRVPGREGAIGYLSRGMLKRATLTESALLAAWLPRLRPDLYDIQTSLRP
jgi:inosine/xanthosine triphosphatase